MKSVLLLLIFISIVLVLCYFKTKSTKLTSQCIPKIIHQTWDSWESIPPSCFAVIDRVKQKNKDWSYMFHSMIDRRTLIAANFDDEIVQAFDKLPTSTSQADLFRVCCLYVHGGFYMDIKSECGELSSLNKKLNGKLLYCKWPYGTGPLDHPRHAATFLLWPKRHPVLKAIINEIAKRIHANSVEEIKKNITLITGPNVYADIFWQMIPEHHVYYSEDYVNGFFVHDGTNGEYYHYMKSRKLHWSQQT